jgi:Zn-dependent protease with chaperone function
MTAVERIRKGMVCVAACAVCFAGVGTAKAPWQAKASKGDEEVQMGQEVYDQLKAKGEIVESSPLYDVLRPMAENISRAAQPQYNHPFKFFLVHEEQPNAFATPGGNVYVVDSLMYFVKNTDELSGTLCHETSRPLIWPATSPGPPKGFMTPRCRR